LKKLRNINGLGLSPGGRISKSIRKPKNNQRFRAKPLKKQRNINGLGLSQHRHQTRSGGAPRIPGSNGRIC
jgi:hypothetical protein